MVQFFMPHSVYCMWTTLVLSHFISISLVEGTKLVLSLTRMVVVSFYRELSVKRYVSHFTCMYPIFNFAGV